jgi:hypothetical protein
MVKKFAKKMPMKNAVLQKKLHALEQPEISSISPDISLHVQSKCTDFNSRVLNIRQAILTIANEIAIDGFDKTMLNQNGEEALIDFFDDAEALVHATRAGFERFYAEYEQLLKTGCRVDRWSKIAVKNANDATRDALRNFVIDREQVMERVYDALPSHIRLGNSRVFGHKKSPKIRDYIAAIKA